ncbi:ubiquitin [Artemisia annua]|uniref:Ubiquitin n=1 Tax=Artemisia annua TaxID=35608 RepID=A0A2U1N9Y1_ARTAN|nr:ubiquitin [Artemisia annua]
MVLEGIIILAEFGIKKGSTLTLMRKSKQIKDDWEYFRIPLDEQVLIFKEMVLDDKSILSDFHINNDSTLTLLRMTGGFMEIFVKTLNGVTISLRVKPSNTIAEVKAYITLERDIPLENITIRF